MNPKNLATVTVIVLVLAVISFMQNSSHKNSTSQSATATLLDGNLSIDNISKLTMGIGNDAAMVSLTKNSNQRWIVDSAWGAPGNSETISQLLSTLAGLKGEFRSDKAEVLQDYLLDDAQALALKGYKKDGTVAFEILVGKAPVGAQGNFIRLPSDNRVHLSQTNILAPLGLRSGLKSPENKTFINLKTFNINRLTVNKIILENEGQFIALEKVFAMTEPDDSGAAATQDRNTWEWKLASDESKALDKTKVDNVAHALLGLRALDVDNPAGNVETYGLGTPIMKATIFLENGTSQLVEFGAQRPAGPGGSSEATLPAGRWLHVVEKNEIWIVSDVTVSNIFKNVDELMAE